jgi:hypothetical protein
MVRGEAVLVPTYRRPELLFCCLKRIRPIEPEIPIHVIPDRGSALTDEQTLKVAHHFGALIHIVPDHEYYGNSYNTMEGFRALFNQGYTKVYYVEDDVMVHPDFFAWHRRMHEEFPDIFASIGWVFNRYAPIMEGELFAPWYYSVGSCFSRDKLFLVVQHASPKYYGDMAGYIKKKFPESTINFPHAIAHYEQDGLIQRILDRDRSQAVTYGIAKCSHIGFGGYNRGWNPYEDFFQGETDFLKRVEKIESLYADPYWRAAIFDRAVVEREIGHELPHKERRYRLRLSEGWETEFASEVGAKYLPRRVHSVPLPKDFEIESLETTNSVVQ